MQNISVAGWQARMKKCKKAFVLFIRETIKKVIGAALSMQVYDTLNCTAALEKIYEEKQG